MGSGVRGGMRSPGQEGDSEGSEPIIISGRGGLSDSEGKTLSPLDDDDRQDEAVTPTSTKATKIRAVKKILQRIENGEYGEGWEYQKPTLVQYLEALNSSKDEAHLAELTRQVNELLQLLQRK